MDVKLVSIFVNVTDRNGALVGGLAHDDFRVSEDGRPQQIAVFEKQSELPLNLTLAIDTSGSVRKDMTEEAGAARRFAHAILRPQDLMSVMQFATDVRELTPFTNKLPQIDRGLSQLHGDWATALYDAISLGSERLGQKEGRKVLVLISDGDDTAKNTTYGQALEQALRGEVMIHRGQRRTRPGRGTRADHAGRADGRQILLRGRRWTRQGLCKGQRRSAHAVSAWLLSPQPGAGKNLPSHRGRRSQGIGWRVHCPPQDRVLCGRIS
jgi:VWFA-related protein